LELVVPSWAENEKIMYIIMSAGIKDRGFNRKRSKNFIADSNLMVVLLVK
jgi:predicted ATP-grasp superfamily ATP-dependent carboligase